MQRMPNFVMTAALAAALLLSSCAAPGVSVSSNDRTGTQSEPTALSEKDLRATIEAETRATIEAEQRAEASKKAQPSTAVEASDAAEANDDAQASAEPEPTAKPGPSAEATEEPTQAASAAPAETTQAAASQAPAASQSPAAPVAAGDGTIAAFSRNGRYSVLTRDGWQQPVMNLNVGDTCSSYSSGISFAGNGTAWSNCGPAQSDDGVTWNKPSERGLYGNFFTDPKGRVWNASNEEIKVLENGTWTGYKALLATQEESFPYRTAAFSADGTAYFGGSNSKGSKLVSFDGQTWKAYKDVTFPNDAAPGALLVTSKGDVFAATNAVYKLNGEKFTEVIPSQRFADILKAYSFYGDIKDMVEAPDGTLLLATDDGLFTWDGSKLDIIDREAGLPSNAVRDIALDANGNIWLATSHGVATRVGDTWQVAVPGTSGLTDSDLLSIAVKGAPTLPAPEAQPKTTTITGRVVAQGKPLANADVELCSEISNNSRRNVSDTPCGNNFYTQRVKTDDQGNFKFENVPVGAYGTAVRDDAGRWYVPSRLSILALEPGAEVTDDIDLGN